MGLSFSPHIYIHPLWDCTINNLEHLNDKLFSDFALLDHSLLITVCAR